MKLRFPRRTRRDARRIVDRVPPKDGGDPDDGIRRGEDADLHAASDAQLPSHNGPPLRQEHEERDVRDFIRQVKELGRGLEPCTRGPVFARVKCTILNKAAAMIKILVNIITPNFGDDLVENIYDFDEVAYFVRARTCIVARQRVTVVRVLPVGGELEHEHDSAEDHGAQQHLDRCVILLGLYQQHAHLDWVMLGLCWGYVGVMLGLCWVLCWGYVGVMLGFMLGLCWGYVGVMLGWM